MSSAALLAPWAARARLSEGLDDRDRIFKVAICRANVSSLCDPWTSASTREGSPCQTATGPSPRPSSGRRHEVAVAHSHLRRVVMTEEPGPVVSSTLPTTSESRSIAPQSKAFRRTLCVTCCGRG